MPVQACGFKRCFQNVVRGPSRHRLWAFPLPLLFFNWQHSKTTTGEPSPLREQPAFFLRLLFRQSQIFHIFLRDSCLLRNGSRPLLMLPSITATTRLNHRRACPLHWIRRGRVSMLFACFRFTARAVQRYLVTVEIGISRIRHIPMFRAFYKNIADSNLHRTHLER